MDTESSEVAPAKGASKEEADQVQRSAKKAKRFWTDREGTLAPDKARSFVDVVTRGSEGALGGLALSFEDEVRMEDEEEPRKEGDPLDDLSDWDTESDEEDSDGEEEELCPTILLSSKEKRGLRMPWATW